MRSTTGVGTKVDKASMIAAYWDAVGIEAIVKPMEPVAFVALAEDLKHDCYMENTANAFPLSTLKNEFLPASVSNWAMYDNPEFAARYEEAAQTVDKAKQDTILKELCVTALDDVPYIPLSATTYITYWWPWVKNYYGEFEDSAWGNGYFTSTLWIDQDLKAEMGY